MKRKNTAPKKNQKNRTPNPGKRPAIRTKPSRSGQQEASFASLLRPLIPDATRPLPRPVQQTAPLAHLSYGTEVKLKDKGLDLFWKHHRLAAHPQPLIHSPQPRGYRTTSKRRAVLRGSTLFLLLGETGKVTQKRPFLPSPLEPDSHTAIYQFLQAKLSEPSFRLLASHLNYLIIRGSYQEQAVIFNVDHLDGPLVRKLKIVASHLEKLDQPLKSVFVYPDPSRSAYYLESRRPADLIHFKKLCGHPQLAVSHYGKRYLFHPTSFSQVNQSITPLMLEKAKAMLAPGQDQRLIDLYCGYGLFSHFLAPHYREVLGLDLEGPSIRSASANSRMHQDKVKIRFLARKITEENLLQDLPPEGGSLESVLLDPPKHGPEPGVIETLAQRRPDRVLHIFCGIDEIPGALKRWGKTGYSVQEVVPLDMFPGTLNMEVMVLLGPAK